MNCLEEAGGIWLLQDRASFSEISLLFSTSGSGWQSLSRPWGFPNKESSPPSSTRVYHPPPCIFLSFRGPWLLGPSSCPLEVELCAPSFVISSLALGEDKSRNAPSPGPYSPCFSYRFLEVQGGHQIPLLLPCLPSQLHSGYVLPRPTGGTQVQIRLPEGASSSQRESRHAAR